jgi:hypothetical protein
MRAVIFSTIWRTFDNILPALDQLIATGGVVAGVFVPYRGDPYQHKFLEVNHLSNTTVINVEGDDAAAFRRNFNVKLVASSIIKSAKSIDADIIVLTNNFFEPYASIYLALEEEGCALPIAAAQHGLLQPWNEHESRITCDFFLAFGRIHVAKARKTTRYNALQAGLPKLDRLYQYRRATPREIVLFADPGGGVTWANESAYVEAVDALATMTPYPIVVRGHPMFKL